MFFTNPRLEKVVDDIFENSTSRFSPMFNSTIIKKYYDLPIISKDENGVEVKLTLAGYEREDLEISIEDGLLKINTIEDLSEDLESVERSFEIDDKLDSKSCTATMKAGILTVSFDYKKPKKAKKIKIN